MKAGNTHSDRAGDVLHLERLIEMDTQVGDGL